MQHSSSISGCPPAKSTPTMCSGLPSLRKTQERAAAFVKYRWQPSILWEENCSKLKCDWKTRGVAQACCCAQSGQRFTAGSKLYCDHLRHTVKWVRMQWVSTTKAWSILAPTIYYELQRWKSHDKMLSRAAAVCPGERINSVSIAPQRDPTQFLTAIWILALFPVSNFPLIHNTPLP